MFSAGNVTERHRIASLKCDNEVIVDLFAGIGYFTLPFLVHANARLVHACEWNPDAIDSLRLVFFIMIFLCLTDFDILTLHSIYIST